MTKSFNIYLKAKCGDTTMTVAMHPGTVRTVLSKEFCERVPKGQPRGDGGEDARRCGGTGHEARGGFFDRKGEKIEW